MTDHVLIVAELRAGELLMALEDALHGHAHWRFRASELLRSIARCELPNYTTEALREVDARKRAPEILADVCSDG
jgi:hypothetical protein